MKYFVYAAIAALIVWSLWYLIARVRRQLRGDCGCGCDGCGMDCDKRQSGR